MTPQLLDDIDDYQSQFDANYVAGIPLLLNESGGFLSFLSIISATEALAGLFEPKKGTGERYRLFIKSFFPVEYHQYAEQLWELRNSVVHSFNPGGFFALTSRTSRYHLKSPTGQIHLNAENYFAALLFASRAYFERLQTESDLQAKFQQRTNANDGGAMETFEVQMHARPIN